jgi:5'-nucleotidase
LRGIIGKILQGIIVLLLDPFVLEELNKWKKNVTLLGNTQIGTTKVVLDGDTTHCRVMECNLGNFITDAYVDYVSIAKVNLYFNR